jgi:phage terminase small subunit
LTLKCFVACDVGRSAKSCLGYWHPSESCGLYNAGKWYFFKMSRRKTASEQIRDGDPAKRGVKVLDRLAATEPETQSGLECPARLRGDARELFRFFAEQLELSDLDAKPDSPALAIACEALATSWKAERRLRRESEIIRTPIYSGQGSSRKKTGWKQSRNRWFAVKIESQKMFDRIAGKFGLVGPSSRAGLEVNATPRSAHDSLMARLTAPRTPKPPAEPDPVQ